MITTRITRARPQRGQRIETASAFFVRFYQTSPNGERRQKSIKVADKTDVYRTWRDVDALVVNIMLDVNAGIEPVRVATESLSSFVEDDYLPYCRENCAASTAHSYTALWGRHWKPAIGHLAMSSVTTADVTRVLTHLAGHLGTRSLSHAKWFLSGAYKHAISKGMLPLHGNPAEMAKWLKRVDPPKKQTEYSLQQVMKMIEILEPLDLRAAVAVALCYFAALRPAEVRGLTWGDWEGDQLHIRRSMWRTVVGRPKTHASAASVPVIEPLRSLLQKLRPTGLTATVTPIIQAEGQPLSLNSLNGRLIAPAMRKAGILWRGFYPCRRGISSLVTSSSNNVLNSTGLLRHSNPSTTLRHYTQSNQQEIEAALKTVEAMATVKPEEVIQ
jgi:integrase